MLSPSSKSLKNNAYLSFCEIKKKNEKNQQNLFKNFEDEAVICTCTVSKKEKSEMCPKIINLTIYPDHKEKKIPTFLANKIKKKEENEKR